MKALTFMVGAFIFIVLNSMGIEQGAITNSPVDCLCDAATSVSEAIGMAVPRQIPITAPKAANLRLPKRIKNR